MYGKHFESMYEGSMYGAGVAVFAVWGYVISHTKNSRVELNPRVLANTLGASVKEISGALAVLMAPDAESRHQEHDGRRLIQEGKFQYFVPSFESYQRIRNEDERREYNRIKQAELRAKRRAQGGTLRVEHRDDEAGARDKRNGLKRKKPAPLLSPEEEEAAARAKRLREALEPGEKKNPLPPAMSETAKKEAGGEATSKGSASEAG